jgi:hypothetical protein
MLSLTWLSQLVEVHIDALMAMAVGVSLGCQRTQGSAECQDCVMADLAATVRQCPLASAAGGDGCYSLGYSVASAHADDLRCQACSADPRLPGLQHCAHKKK